MKVIHGLAAAALAAAGILSAPAVASASAPAPDSAACHPLTSGGTCYEPGEFCPARDHDALGLAGDGKAIVCWNNHGWRWEPVPRVTLSCTVIPGGPTGVRFIVSARTLSREYIGSLPVSFSDYPGSGHRFLPARVFPDRYVTPMTPWTARVSVPAADIGASARPTRCTASV